MPQSTEIALIEMGANHPGEIAALCKIAAPTHGLITNVGRAHLEGFGSFEGVKKTKAELYHWLQHNNGITFINKDENFLSEMAASTSNKFYYQTATDTRETSHFFIQPQNMPPYIGAQILNNQGEIDTIQSHLVGDYNFENIKTALAIGNYFKIGPDDLKKGIEDYRPSNNRSQLIHDKNQNTIIMDAYNANPVSMEKALKNLANTHFGAAQKIAIIGDMLELGKDSAEAHEKILTLVKTLAIDKTILVGKEFCKVAPKFKSICFPNVQALRTWFDQQDINNSIMLLKGSRGIGLEQLFS